MLIDGVPVPVRPGQTIMEAARAADIYIPHLCYHPAFRPHGSCRLCMVRSGPRFVAACTQPAAPGLQVENDTDELNELRRTNVQMLFVEGNHICPACEKSGACQLQAVAYQLGMLAPEFRHQYPVRTLDASHPDAVIDYNRCILCELCVRASRDMDGKGVFAIEGRGAHARLVVNTESGRLGDSSFEATDMAARVCPVGAILPRGESYRVPIGQRLYDRGGIDEMGDAAAQGGTSDEP
jgi:[NiFe] hydrogenase diaphorase moiety small subunit